MLIPTATLLYSRIPGQFTRNAVSKRAADSRFLRPRAPMRYLKERQPESIMSMQSCLQWHGDGTPWTWPHPSSDQPIEKKSTAFGPGNLGLFGALLQPPATAFGTVFPATIICKERKVNPLSIEKMLYGVEKTN